MLTCGTRQVFALGIRDQRHAYVQTHAQPSTLFVLISIGGTSDGGQNARVGDGRLTSRTHCGAQLISMPLMGADLLSSSCNKLYFFSVCFRMITPQYAIPLVCEALSNLRAKPVNSSHPTTLILKSNCWDLVSRVAPSDVTFLFL